MADTAEGPHEVSGIDRSPGSGREHESGLRPRRANVGPVGSLPGCLEFEHLAGEVQRREVTLPRMGLDGAELELATYALELLANLDRPGLEVNVLPIRTAVARSAQAAVP
jgi:hypothetical protein